MIHGQAERGGTGHDRVRAVSAVADQHGLGTGFLEREDLGDLPGADAGILAFARGFDGERLLAVLDSGDGAAKRGGDFLHARLSCAARADEQADFRRRFREAFRDDDAARRLDDGRAGRRAVACERAAHQELAIGILRHRAARNIEHRGDHAANRHVVIDERFAHVLFELARDGQVFVHQRLAEVDRLVHARERFDIRNDGASR